MTTYQVFNEQLSDTTLADGDLIMVWDTSAGTNNSATIKELSQYVGAPVATTATTLAVTAASHAGRLVVINSAAPIAVSLPASSGGGAVYSFKIGVVATATSHTIAANGTDVIEGIAIGISDNSANAVGWLTTATSDKVSANGTTTGGDPGDTWVFVDAESGTWQVNGVVQQTGTEATPFSET
jgi:hypothetical protein